MQLVTAIIVHIYCSITVQHYSTPTYMCMKWEVQCYTCTYALTILTCFPLTYPYNATPATRACAYANDFYCCVPNKII